MPEGNFYVADLFISYRRSDADRVQTLVDVLSGYGLSIWWDRHLEQNSTYQNIIRGEITAAKCVVVCWSEGAQSSQWVLDEADEAKHLGKYVGCLIAPGRAAMGYNTLNNANLSNWAGDVEDPAFLMLLKEIGRMSGREDLAGLADSKQRHQQESEAKKTAAEAAARDAEIQRQQREADEHRRKEEAEARLGPFKRLARDIASAPTRRPWVFLLGLPIFAPITLLGWAHFQLSPALFLSEAPVIAPMLIFAIVICLIPVGILAQLVLTKSSLLRRIICVVALLIVLTLEWAGFGGSRVRELAELRSHWDSHRTIADTSTTARAAEVSAESVRILSYGERSQYYSAFFPKGPEAPEVWSWHAKSGAQALYCEATDNFQRMQCRKQ